MVGAWECYASEISQKEKDKYIWPHLHVESRNKKISYLHLENRFVVARDKDRGFGAIGEGESKGTNFQIENK